MAEGATAFVRFKKEGRYEHERLDLDELSDELAEFAPPEQAGRPLAAPGAHHCRLRGDPALRRSAGARRRAWRETGDIFERLYAVRLDRIRALEECRSVLEPLDHQGLLAAAEAGYRWRRGDRRRDLLAELADFAGASDITELRACARRARKSVAAEEIANRAAMRRLRHASSRCSRKCSGKSPPASGNPAHSRRRPRSKRAAGSSSADRRPISPRRARYSPSHGAHGPPSARNLRQRH